MRSDQEVVQLFLQRFRAQQISQVPGYNRFGYVGETPSAVIVSRERGENTRIPFAKLEAGAAAVRTEPTVYEEGPSRLRSHGITHINSPVWSLLHLIDRDEILL